jgi:hypothetical protein
MFCLLVSAHKHPSYGLFSAMFLTFSCFLLAISLFKMVCKPSAEVLCSSSGILVMCLMGDIHVLDQLCSDVNYRVVGVSLGQLLDKNILKCLVY